MFKKILGTTLICIFFLMYGAESCLEAAVNDNNHKLTIVFFINELKISDLEGQGLPNMKKLQESGVSYQHISTSVSSPKEGLFSLLGQKDTDLLLPQALINNGFKCLIVDGSAMLPQTVFKSNQIDVISEKSDHLAIEDLLKKFSNDHAYEFVVIYLDDVSSPAKDLKSNSFNKWSAVDNQVGRVINNLINSGKLSKSTIILTGGGDSPPLIMYGNSIKAPANYFYCHQLDVSPTICKINDITPPAKLPGSVLYESLVSSNNNLQNRINDLQKECLLKNQEIELFKQEQKFVQTQKASIDEERKKNNEHISEKNQQIKRLITKIMLYKIGGIIVLFLILLGYIIQYKILRKKFIMF